MDVPRSQLRGCGSDTHPGPPHSAAVPARPPPTKPSRFPVGFAVPAQTLQIYVRFLRRAGTHAAFCTSRVVVAAREERRQTGGPGRRLQGCSDSHAAPTAPRARPAPEAQDFRPPPPAPLPTNATRRRCALRSSGEPRDGRVGGGARRSRRPSRACRSHVSVRVTCSRRSQSRRTLSRSKEAVVRHRPRPEMFSSLAPAASGAVAAATETTAAAATRRSSFRG